MKKKKVAAVIIAVVLIVACYAVLRNIIITNEYAANGKPEESLNDSDIRIEDKKVAEINLKNIQGEENYTGERNLYYMNLALSADEKKLRGYQVVKFKNNYKSSLKDLVFHLYADSYNSAETKPSIGRISGKLTKDEIGDIKIDSIKVSGKTMDYTQDKQVLKIMLDKELRPGEIAEAAIEFTLKIPKSTDRLGYMNNQFSLTNWYPILSIYDEKKAAWDETPFHPVGESNYSDCSDYMVSISVPKGMVVTGTGINTSKQENSTMDVLKFEAKNNRDFVMFLSKDYKVLSADVDGIKINSYYFKEEDTAERMLNLASEAIKFYNKVYGKYPYPEYDVVETYLNGGAMEYPTATQMGPYTRLDSDYRKGSLTFFDEAVVHETAHQWWYSTVGNNEFKEPVLDETFTSYATALFFEKQFGEYNPLAVKASFLTMPVRNYGPISRSTDQYNWNNFSLIVYKVAPIILEDLRQKVGEEKFLIIFRTYYNNYKYKNATLENFFDIVKDTSGEAISDYVRQAFTSGNYTNASMTLPQEEINRIGRNAGK